MRSVSVIVPTYNDGARLLAALHSIAAQTYPHERIEIVVIDDGSNDGTVERVAEFTARAPLMTRYARQNNAGPAAARNHGLRLARGDTVAFLDADDTWHPAKLAHQLPRLSDRVGLVYCDAAFVDAHGAPLKGYVREIALHRGDILLPLFCDFFLLTSAVVLSRAVIDAAGIFDERLPVGEDYEFFLRVASLCHGDCIGEKLLVRCVRADSLSRRDYVRDARVDLDVLTRFLRDHPDFAVAHRATVNRRIARYRHDFAWQLLADGKRREAVGELLQSLRTSASVASARTLLRALLPHSVGASG